MTVRITGDVHGLTKRYVDDVKKSLCEYSLQIGDMGFHYQDLLELDPERHKFIGGNHDNYDIYHACPYALGDFGSYTLEDLEFFFIRGAFSIDYVRRVQNEMLTGKKSWWPQEQLSRQVMELAFHKYCNRKPTTMITHSCPSEIGKIIGSATILQSFGFEPEDFNTNTQALLQACFDAYKPKTWIFGHFHRTLDFVHKGTRFICLGELRHIEYEDGDFKNNNRLDGVQQ